MLSLLAGFAVLALAVTAIVLLALVMCEARLSSRAATKWSLWIVALTLFAFFLVVHATE